MARTLGRTLAEMEAGMSGAEYALWEAEYRISPWGDWPAQVMQATVAATVANVNRGKDSPVYSPQDFIPWAEKQQEEQEEDPIEFLTRIGKI